MLKLRTAACLATLVACALPAAGWARDIQYVITDAGTVDGEGRTGIDLLIVNDDPAERSLSLPDRVEAFITTRGTHSLWLERDADVPATVSVPAKGFARARYHFAASFAARAASALVSIPSWSTQQVAISPRVADAGRQLAAAPASDDAPATAAHEGSTVRETRTAGMDGTVQTRIERRANSLFDNLSVYEPTYVVKGSSEDSELRVQLSFKYQILGSNRKGDPTPSWHDGLYLGFTQRLFWDLASDASFRDTNYIPELFYRTPAFEIGDTLDAGVQLGIQHESNGKSGPTSRSLNAIYVAPMAAWDLGGGYSLSLSPRLSILIGGRAGNPDIRSYRGATSLNAQIGKDDGFRLAASGRLNASTGRGALTTELSYPLPRIFGGGPEFYLFGQSFVGYGESLLDYNRHVNRFRIGLAIAR